MRRGAEGLQASGPARLIVLSLGCAVTCDGVGVQGWLGYDGSIHGGDTPVWFGIVILASCVDQAQPIYSKSESGAVSINQKAASLRSYLTLESL